jgi:chromosome segregation ATPase
LVTPCRNHGCNCKKIENRLLLVQNIHGYLGHIYEENLGRECENPFAKRQKLDYEIEELKVQNQRLSDQVSELQKNVTKNNENVEAKENLINLLGIDNENRSDQVDKLQNSLKSKDEEIGSKNVEIESLKERLKTEAKERSKNFVSIERPIFVKLYAENKKFFDALRKYKEALESKDKEIENLSGQIDKLQGILKTKIKEIADLNECLQKAKANEKDDLGEHIKDLKAELKKSKEKNSALQDDKIELFEKIAQEKQKNDALEEIISQKERNVQIACKENTRVELEKRKLEEMLQLRKEGVCVKYIVGKVLT